MEIVKELKADLSNISSLDDNDKNNVYYLIWGLGDDGKLYYKNNFDFDFKHDLPRTYLITNCWTLNHWFPYEKSCFGISLSEMYRIVKEFGNLLVFI